MTDEVQLMDDIVKLSSTIEVPEVGIIDANFLRIDENHIGEDLERQAGYYAFWSVAVADAQRDSAQADLNVKVVRAEVRRELKEDFGKITVADLDAAVDEDGRVIASRMAAIDLDYRCSVTKAIMYALQQKKDMLSSRVGLTRTEMELTMKELGQ